MTDTGFNAWVRRQADRPFREAADQDDTPAPPRPSALPGGGMPPSTGAPDNEWLRDFIEAETWMQGRE